jgi:hypothetical protein
VPPLAIKSIPPSHLTQDVPAPPRRPPPPAARPGGAVQLDLLPPHGGPALLFPTATVAPQPLAYGWLVPETPAPAPPPRRGRLPPVLLYQSAAPAELGPPEPGSLRSLLVRRRLSRQEGAFAFIAALAMAVAIAHVVSGAIADFVTSPAPPGLGPVLPADAARLPGAAASAAAASAAAAAAAWRAAAPDLDWLVVGLLAAGAALGGLVCFRFGWAMLLSPAGRRRPRSPPPPRRGGAGAAGASPLAVSLPRLRRESESEALTSEEDDEDEEEEEEETTLL